MSEDLTPELMALKEELTRRRGHWHPLDEVLLRRDPVFLRSYFEMAQAPFVTAGLPRKVCEFVYIAVDASVDHMYPRGLQRHIDYALQFGATPEEVLEVIQICCSLAAQTQEMGLAMLADESQGVGLRTTSLDAEQEQLRASFEQHVGYWPAWGNLALGLAPGYARGLLGVLSHPWENGVLEPKVKEFIHIALNAAPTALNAEAIRFHIGRALDLGATVPELSEVLQLSSGIAMHGAIIGVPMLEQLAALPPSKSNEA